MHHKKFRLATILAVVLSIGVIDQVMAVKSSTNATPMSAATPRTTEAGTWIKNATDFPVRIHFHYIDGTRRNTTSVIKPYEHFVSRINLPILPYEALTPDGTLICTNDQACTSGHERIIVFRGTNEDGTTCNFTCT